MGLKVNNSFGFGDDSSGGGGGLVNSVTGLNTNNTDPTNPIVKISVDGSTVTGSGTPDDPLVARLSSNTFFVSFHFNTNFAPSSNQTYYFGQQATVGNTINGGVAVPIPRGTITEVITNTYVAGSFGSSDGSTLTLYTNTNSDTPTSDVIATGVQFATGNPRNFSQSFEVNIPVVSGGSIIEIATPTFESAPSSATVRVGIIIQA